MTAATQAPESTESAEDSNKRERDFTKFRPSHEELAKFINEHPEWKAAELGDVSPNVVKAVLALKTDFNDTPEKRAEREARKRELEEEKKLFEGMTAEQIAQEKAARKAEKQAEKLEAKIREAREKAEAIRSGKVATGADLAAAVEAQQAEGGKRTLGRSGQKKTA